MVCERCVSAVTEALEGLELEVSSINLGTVTVRGTIPEKSRVAVVLNRLGFELLEDRNEAVVKTVEQLAAEVWSGNYDFPDSFRFSALVRERLNRDYDAVNSAFSRIQGETIEQYCLRYRIGKVGEYLVYTELGLSEIAFRFNFTSVPHLSAQFKKLTGMNPSAFRAIRRNKQRLIAENENQNSKDDETE